jgi:hypothetical protein
VECVSVWWMCTEEQHKKHKRHRQWC